MGNFIDSLLEQARKYTTSKPTNEAIKNHCATRENGSAPLATSRPPTGKLDPIKRIEKNTMK